jgi:hypothetical protein
VLRKSEGLQGIHHPEVGVSQLTRLCLGLRIGDHLAIDIDAHDVDVREGGGQIQRPASGPTGNIEEVVPARKIVVCCGQSSHTRGDETVLFHQARHFSSIFGIQNVAAWLRTIVLWYLEPPSFEADRLALIISNIVSHCIFA